MLLEAAQAASQAMGGGAYITGTFVVDGAILLAVLKAVEFGIGKIKPRNGNGKHVPQAGESDVCRLRGERITKAETKVEGIEGTLRRIEGKVDRMLERGRS